MVDEQLRKPRRKPRVKLQQYESPFPIPIETITGKSANDKRWYFFFGQLHNDHVSVSRLGDLTFLYRLGFFGKGILSRSQPQFEKYRDALLLQGKQNLKEGTNDIIRERLRQRMSWIENDLDSIPAVDKSKSSKTEDTHLDVTLLASEDLHTNIDDDSILEEYSSETDDTSLFDIKRLSKGKRKNIETENEDIENKEAKIFKKGDEGSTNEENVKEIKIIDSSVGNEKDCNNISHQNIDPMETFTNEKDASEISQEVVDTQNCEGLLEKDLYQLYECLQLTFEEAFFLSYGLGCLAITSSDDHKMTLNEMWCTFSKKQSNFIPMYAAYHHFRSKGWVVRFSKMYGLDFVLYQDGMAFHHASYCVIVNFVSERDYSQQEKQLCWKNISALCRINERAGKEILFCYIVRPENLTDEELKSPTCIKSFKIMEIIMRRWQPEKFRECKD